MGKPTKNRPHNREIRKTYLNKTIQKVKVKALTHRESAQLERAAQLKRQRLL